MSRFVLPLESTFNINGAPQDGAKLEFFNPGLLTNKDTYSDQALTTANTNPVVANASGRFGAIWMNGDYDVTLKDKNDVLIWGPERVLSNVTNDDAFKLNEATTATMAADTAKTYVVGDVVETKEFSTGNGGGGTYDCVTVGTTANVDLPNTYNIIVSTVDATKCFVLRSGSVVDIRSIGVVGDGVADDTAALQQATTYPSIIGHSSLSIRTTASVDFDNACDFNLNGATILGESTADTAPWLYVKSSNVNVYGGTFGDGTLTGKPIAINDYDLPDTTIRSFNIYNNLFNVGDMATNRGIISGIGKTFELNIYNNRFQSGAALTSKNVACVYMQLSSAVVDFETQLKWNVSNNLSVGIPYLFNNFSTAYAANVNISKNTVRNGEDSIRTYHLYECTVSENVFIEPTGILNIWQRTNFINNIIQRSTNATAAVKFETPTSNTISGNDIRNATGAGAILDGGNATYTFNNNNIYNSGGDGLIVDSAYSFGGQLRGLQVSSNRITENYGNGIKVVVSSALRNAYIQNNYIAGNGKDNVSTVAGIELDTTANNEINELLISGNTIRNNDATGGIQTANTQQAVRMDGGTSHSATMIICDNKTYTAEMYSDTRASGGGSITITNNLSQELIDPIILGVQWFGNYNDTVQQTGHRRNSGTPVGVLTPLWLGEEVFDTSGQNWYKSVGASAGPWTTSNWKIIT